MLNSEAARARESKHSAGCFACRSKPELPSSAGHQAPDDAEPRDEQTDAGITTALTLRL